MSTDTRPPVTDWNPTTLQKVAALLYVVGSFKVVVSALIVGALVGAFLGQWMMYAAIILVLWFQGKTAFETATYPPTGQRVYGFHNLESRDSANARKEAENNGQGEAAPH